MYSIKVAWVGRTFALAKGNDSGEKKSRIRRSKEERKAMVESFIKKYQYSNNGNFPSLNLTHKEVGGSFYTVREIVREIIQENRVLGPSKLTTDEQNNVPFYDQYPLGSISTEPPSHLSLSSNETHLVSNDHQNITEEPVGTSSSQFTDNGRYINGISVNEENKETDASKFSVLVNEEMLYKDVQTSPNIVEASTFNVTHLATDAIVETFPIKSTTKLSRGMDGRSDDDLTGTLEKEETKKVELVSEKHDFDAMDEKSAANQVISGVMESKDLQVDVSCNDGLTWQTSDHNQLVSGTEAKLTSNDAHAKNTNGDKMSGTCEELLSQEAVVIESKAQSTLSTTEEGRNSTQSKLASNDAHTENTNGDNTSSTGQELLSQEAIVIESKAQNTLSTTEEGRNSTLNRTKLESWEGPSKEQTNPVWEVLKAFVAAFVKFWTE